MLFCSIYSITSESVKYVFFLHILLTYIIKNIVAKLQKLYSLPRNQGWAIFFACAIFEKTSLHGGFTARMQNIH